MNTLSDKEAPQQDKAASKQSDNAMWPLGSQPPGTQMLDGEPGGPNMLNFNSGASGQNSAAASGGVGEGVAAAAGLGDLASLTVANESENGADMDQSEGGGTFLLSDGLGQKQSASAVTPAGARRPWAKKYVLRGHFDAVRSATFHPSEPYLFSAGEDGMVMLWALHRPGSPKPVRTVTISSSNCRHPSSVVLLDVVNCDSGISAGIVRSMCFV